MTVYSSEIDSLWKMIVWLGFFFYMNIIGKSLKQKSICFPNSSTYIKKLLGLKKKVVC